MGNTPGGGGSGGPGSPSTPASPSAASSASKKPADEGNTSEKLDERLMKAQSQDRRFIKLLLLGAGESGKSTLFKQMIHMYGKGFGDTDRMGFTNVIHLNVLLGVQALCYNAPTFGTLSPEAEKSRIFLEATKPETRITPEIAIHITTLWQDPISQLAFDNHSKFQLFDSANYFFNKAQELAKETYVPSYEDIIRIRVRTTGIVEKEFNIDGARFKMFDVGGQRTERKKWIHSFESVTAVIFVAAISEYDQLCFEDEKTNRVEEALSLFAEVCNLRWFVKTSIILFLNKRDLFLEKLKKVPLTACFPTYTGPNTYEAGTVLMRDAFVSRNKGDKVIYSHVTCATDKDNVRAVFLAVKDIIIRTSLQQDGLI